MSVPPFPFPPSPSTSLPQPTSPSLPPSHSLPPSLPPYLNLPPPPFLPPIPPLPPSLPPSLPLPPSALPPMAESLMSVPLTGWAAGVPGGGDLKGLSDARPVPRQACLGRPHSLDHCTAGHPSPSYTHTHVHARTHACTHVRLKEGGT